MLGAALALVALVAAATIWQRGREWVQEPARSADLLIVGNQSETVRADGAIVAAWFAQAEGEAAGVAQVIGPWTGASAQVAGARSRLDTVRPATLAFDDGLLVLDRRARVVASTVDRAGLVGQTRVPDEVAAALEGKAEVSSVMTDPLERVRRVAVVIPLRDGRGAVTAALAGLTRVPAGSLWRTLARIPGAVVVTPDGGVLDGRAGGSEGAERADADLLVPARAVSGNPVPGVEGGQLSSSVMAYDGQDGTRRVAGAASAGHGYAVVFPLPDDLFTATTAEVGRRTRATLSALFVLGLAAALLLESLRRRTARRADRERTAFLAIAGHELRTPLTIVKGMSAVMSRGGATATRAGIEEALGRQARGLEHRIERMLLAADLRAGKVPAPALRPVDLVPVLRDAAADLADGSPTHHFEVPDDGPLWVNGDSRSVEQVVLNVLENAVRFSPAGGTVRVAVRRERGRVVVDVDDEGVGLPSDLVAMFEPFGQHEAPDSRTAEEGGMGLGLFICAALMGRMGGSITAHRRGGGARFALSFVAADVVTD